MSKLRPECRTSGPGDPPALSRETTLFLLRDSIDRRHGLIHGRLHDGKGGHCAIGCFWEDNPKTTLKSDLIDEVATVNDSLGPDATPRQRWLKVRSWLRYKLRAIAGVNPRP